MELYIKIYDAPKCAGGAVTQDWYFSEQQGRPVWKGTLEPRPPWPKGASLARWGKRPPGAAQTVGHKCGCTAGAAPGRTP